MIATHLHRRLRGFTLLELIVVVVLISLLGTVAVERLLYYQERAEQATVNATLEAVKMGLRIRMAELMVSNRGTELAALEHENPIQWLEQPPAGYAGEYVVPPKAGGWYFAPQTHELIYVPNSRAHLEGGTGPARELHYRVALRRESGSQSIVGVTVLPVKPFKWF